MKKLLKFVLPLKKQLAIMILFLFIQVLGTLYIPTLTADIVNQGIVLGDVDYIRTTGTVMIGVAAATGIISILGTYLSSFLASSLGKNIRSALFRKSQEFSTNDFNKFGAASMITRNTHDIMQIQQTFSALVERLLPAPIMIIIGLFLAFSKDTVLGFLIIGAMIIVAVSAIAIGKKALPMYDKLQIMLDKINGVLRENITGIRIIRAFNRSYDEKKKEDSAFTEYANTATKVNRIFAIAMPAVMLTMNICAILIIWFGGKKVADNSMQIGDIMAVIEYASMILMYLIMSVMAFMMLPRAEISAKRINEVLNHKLEFESGKERILSSAKGSSKSCPKLEFKDVTFHYKGAEEAVLENISFSVNVGETLAIIGSTGSGKSTIASLIPRMYNIENGEILLDGVNIQTFSEHDLRERIGFVPQKAFLFSGTITDNLRHGKKNASFGDMEKACEVAQAKDFIDNLEDGYNSYVAQAGNNFSGGQKQRLAIARAIIKEPEVYVFDDSFSALDFKTDAKLRLALKQEIKDSAVVIVAQRISTIIDSDKILVLDEGEIVGIGKHKELLANCEIYKQIAQTQLSKEELA